MMYLDTLRELPLPEPGSTVAVAMSGGVDSSLVAQLMAERGCRVVGVTMRVYDGSIYFPPGTGNGCYGPNEEEDEIACQRLCDSLGAPYYVLDLSRPYLKEVVDYFRREYRSGRTPNPCLRCNPHIKFGLLPQVLRERGVSFDYFVTGHYVRLFAPDGDPQKGVYVAPALDTTKDQSYFLQRLTQEILKICRFPLGNYTKHMVREMARQRGLAVADKKDSQDFIAREDYEFLFNDAPIEPGEIVDLQGRLLGTHRGIIRYTIGQRRGVGVSIGTEPLYVVSLDAPRNRVVVGPESALFSRTLEASETIWAPGFGGEPFRALVKIRLASRPALALVIPLPDGRVRVEFEEPQRAIAPGQSAAFYVPLSHREKNSEKNHRSFENTIFMRENHRILPQTILAGCGVIEKGA
ncbi:MAG: tRNA 2-thiouridine(34) synthase MnmA [Treponemataceae bacterium]|nr:tRNA 2-thiouridine(34) synthase MnmA [Treponemataceae bacterium]